MRVGRPDRGRRDGLDRQDGVVLALIKHVYASMRDAAGDGRITPPRIVGALERLVVSTPSGDDEEDPSAPASPTPDPTAT